MNRLVIGAGIAAVVLVVLAMIVPSFIDWTQYRGQVSEIVRDTTGREAEIGGDISFRLLMTPALVASDVKLANVEGGVAENFIELQGINLELDLYKLLVGQISITNIVLDSPRISLERNAAGEYNWDLTAEKPEEQGGLIKGLGDSAVGEAVGDAVDTIDKVVPLADDDRGLPFNRFVIENGTVTYSDAITGRHEELTNISATVLAETRLGPFSATGDLLYEGTPVKFEGGSGRLPDSGPAEVRANLSLGGQTPGLSYTGTADFGGNHEFAGRIKGGGQNLEAFLTGLASLAGARFDSPVNLAQAFDIDAEVNGSDAGGSIRPMIIKIGGSTAEGEIDVVLDASAIDSQVPEDVDAEDADAGPEMVEDESDPGIRVTANLSLNTLRLEDWLGDEAGEGDAAAPAEEAADEPFEIPENLNLTAGIDIAAIDYNGGVIRQVRLAGKASGGQFVVSDVRAELPGSSDLSLSGEVKEAEGKPLFEGKLKMASKNVRGLLDWLEVDTTGAAGGQLANFSLDSSIRADGDQVQAHNLVANLDITEAKGAVAVRFGERRSFAIELTLGRLNLDNYSASSSGKDWPARKQAIIDGLAPLADIDATFKISAEQLTVSGASASGFRSEGRLGGGTLNFTRLGAASFEAVRANFAGRVSGLGGAPSYNLTVDLDSPNLSRALRWLEIDSPYSPEALARASAQGSVSGNLDQVAVDLKGGILGGRYALKGTLGGLNPSPTTLDINVGLRHADHRDLARRLDLGFEMDGEPSEVRVVANAKGSVSDYSGRVKIGALGGTIEIDGRSAEVQGKKSFNAKVTANHSNMATMLRGIEANYTPFQDNLGPVRVLFAVAGDENNYTISGLDATLGPASLRGESQVTAAGEKQKVVGTITGADLPLHAFMSRPRTGAQQAAAGGERWSRQPLDVDWMRRTDMDIVFSAKSVSYNQYRFVNPETALKLQEGVLLVPDLKATLFEGPVALRASFDVVGVPALSLDMEIQNANVAEAAEAGAFIRPGAGKLDMTGRFTATGASQFDLISALDGNVELRARNGYIKGIDIPGITTGWRNVGSSTRLAGFIDQLLGRGQTPYRRLGTVVSINSGVATFEELDNDVDGAKITGAGSIDLPQWTFNIGGDIRFTELPPKTPKMPYTIRGPIDNPSISYRKVPFVAFLAPRVIAGAGGEASDWEAGGPGGVVKDIVNQVLPGKKDNAADDAFSGARMERPVEEAAPDPDAGAFSKDRKPTTDDVLQGVSDLLGNLNEDQPPEDEAPEDENPDPFDD